MNYKYLKRLCEEQRKSIEQWKKYCLREEKLLKRVYDYLDEITSKEVDLMNEIERFLSEEVIGM